MPEKLKGIFEQYEEEIYNNGMKKVINAWIGDGGSIERISERTGMSIDEIYEILNTLTFDK